MSSKRTREGAQKRTAARRKTYKRSDKAHVCKTLTQEQNGRCAICQGAGVQRGDGTHGLVLDHCHATGEPRSMLCGRCNAAVGLVREDEGIATALVDYVRLCAQFALMHT